MNVLSLFNGMSVGKMSLEDAEIKVNKYYISEIDKYANKASMELFPDSIQLGSVCDWRDWDIDWSSIDLVTGGFPCQAWSTAGKQLGDKDERGMLFWVMLDIMKHVKHHNPKANFIVENVRMKKEFEEYITTHTENALGSVHKILINSALVSAQNRNRYYWASFPVTQPEDKGLILADILELEPEEITVMSDKFTNRNKEILRDDVSGKAKNLSAMEYVKNGRQGDYVNVKCGAIRGRYLVNGKRADNTVESMAGKTEQRLELRKDDKTNTLTTAQKDNVVAIREKSKTVRSGGRGSYDRHEWDSVSNCHYRKLTPRECMRLQTIPEHHIDTLLNVGISNTQLYKMTGNAWTMKVISHILKCMVA